MSENDTYNKTEKPNFEDEAERGNFNLDLSWEGNHAWIWGAVLLIGGSILLLQNFFGIHIIRLINWWAIFILVPGLAMLSEAYHAAQRQGSDNPMIRRRAFGGMLLTALALTFFFDLSWAILGPLFLIGLGVFLLINKG